MTTELLSSADSSASLEVGGLQICCTPTLPFIFDNTPGVWYLAHTSTATVHVKDTCKHSSAYHICLLILRTEPMGQLERAVLTWANGQSRPREALLMGRPLTAAEGIRNEDTLLLSLSYIMPQMPPAKNTEPNTQVWSGMPELSLPLLSDDCYSSRFKGGLCFESESSKTL